MKNIGRQAVTTKYLGPTNHRGSRIKATAQAGSITIAWDDGLNVRDNHERAACAFLEKMEWTGTWIGGATVDGSGYTFVEVP